MLIRRKNNKKKYQTTFTLPQGFGIICGVESYNLQQGNIK
jgi:hypothetical protein